MAGLYQGRSSAARYLGITDQEFTAAVAAGEIKPIPTDGPGVGALYRRVDLDAWIASRERTKSVSK
jgi:hypothetical protein